MIDRHKITFETIPGTLIEKWQGIANVLANILSVPAVLVMKTENESMEVFVSSKTDNNPYHAGDTEKRHGQYCETVIKTQKELLIPDATSDSQWHNNPDINLGMIAYLGYPINFPDRRPFGTLCALDTKINRFSTDQRNLIVQFSSVLEMDLAHLEYQHHTTELNKELKESEHHFRTLADSGQALIWTTGVDKKCTYFNQPWLAFTGRTLEQELGDGWTKGVHPDDLQHCVNIFISAFEKREKFSMTYRLRHASGEYHWIQDNGTPRYDSNGDFLGFIGHCLDISETKNTEQRLLESEAFTRAVMDNLPLGLSINSVDPTVNFSYMNDNFVDIYRTTREALASSDSFWTTVYEDPDFRATIKKRILDDCASGDLKRMRWENIPIIRSGQETSYISAQNFPVPMKKLMVSLVLDVTARKKAEETLLQAEQRFRTIVEGAPDAVFVQTEKKFAYLNSHAAKLFGANDETDLLGTPVLDRFHPDFHELAIDRIRRLNEIRQPISDALEQKILRLDGNEVWVETTGQPIIFEGKKGALVFVRNITEHKQSQHSLAAEKERLAVTLRSIGDGVITTDIAGNIVLMNKVAEELTGWMLDEAEGKSLGSVFTIINETTRELHENPVQKVLSTGKVIELANHTLLISRDGTERVIADSGAPIKDKDGKTIGVVLVFRDTTEKQKFIEITQNAQKLESLAVLAGGIAHDFNNLLGGIYGYIDMAGESSKDELVTRYLSKALATIDRARDLTRQLLTFAKGGAPIQKVEKLFPFIQETAQFALSGSNVSCLCDVPQDLWSSNFDRNQIGQVIDNLTINAQQAMPVGGVLKLTARNIVLFDKEHPMLAKGKYVKLSLKDSGIGIPRELLARIFDPFFTTKSKGHGLGLATCYSIISRHNGCIDVDSEPGKGSVFHVYLPASEETAISIGQKSANQYKGSGTFLVMDDEEAIRDTIGHMLRSIGYSVVCKNNGQDAIDFLVTETKANHPLSGMIFDLTIPGGMGGKEAIAEIRKINTDIPVFVASGYAEGPFMKNPADYGFTASISKPFRRIELIEMLQKHMKNRG
jgi:PAS domain S-box-containing protein